MRAIGVLTTLLMLVAAAAPGKDAPQAAVPAPYNFNNGREPSGWRLSPYPRPNLVQRENFGRGATTPFWFTFRVNRRET